MIRTVLLLSLVMRIASKRVLFWFLPCGMPRGLIEGDLCDTGRRSRNRPTFPLRSQAPSYARPLPQERAHVARVPEERKNARKKSVALSRRTKNAAAGRTVVPRRSPVAPAHCQRHARRPRRPKSAGLLRQMGVRRGQRVGPEVVEAVFLLWHQRRRAGCR